MLKLTIGVLFITSVIAEKATGKYGAEKTSQYWLDAAQRELVEALEAQKLNRNVAKNIILIVGDGLGLSTLTAGRILKGQLNGAKGEENSLAIDKMKHVGLSKVYSVDKQVPGSSATATAFLTGVKANFDTVGLNGQAQFENCSSANGNEVTSILEDAYKAGKSTGIISTTTLTHGTPAPAYAHSPSRNWEDDSQLNEDAKLNGCKDIAMQFYEASDMITVTLSGGRQHMQPKSTPDPEYPTKFGKRTDGLFEPEFMQFEGDREDDVAGEPSLTEMVETAIKILRKNENGYFLLVEGGRIDHGHHATMASLALSEVVALDKAVEKAIQMTDEKDTLIIVTADHSHPFTISGFTDRGANIYGLAKTNSQPSLAMDQKTFTTLTYANGPGFHGENVALPYLNFAIPNLSKTTTRKNLTEEETTKFRYMYQSAIPLIIETHSGEDVTIHASGPMSHLFHNVHEQNYIAQVIRYASCLGGMTFRCDQKETSEEENSEGFVIDGRLASILFACTLGLSAAVYVKKTRFS